MPFISFLNGNGIVIINNGDCALFRSSLKKILYVIFRNIVIKMLMLNEYLTNGISLIYESPVHLHQNGLPLCGIVGFNFLFRAFYFTSVSANIV